MTVGEELLMALEVSVSVEEAVKVEEEAVVEVGWGSMRCDPSRVLSLRQMPL